MGYLLGIVFILDQPLLQIFPEPGTGRKEISSCPVPGTSFLAQPANPETGTWFLGRSCGFIACWICSGLFENREGLWDWFDFKTEEFLLIFLPL